MLYCLPVGCLKGIAKHMWKSLAVKQLSNLMESLVMGLHGSDHIRVENVSHISRSPCFSLKLILHEGCMIPSEN